MEGEGRGRGGEGRGGEGRGGEGRGGEGEGRGREGRGGEGRESLIFLHAHDVVMIKLIMGEGEGSVEG